MVIAVEYIWEEKTLDVPLWFAFIKADLISSDMSKVLIFATRWGGPSLTVEVMWCGNEVDSGFTGGAWQGFCYFHCQFIVFTPGIFIVIVRWYIFKYQGFT